MNALANLFWPSAEGLAAIRGPAEARPRAKGPAQLGGGAPFNRLALIPSVADSLSDPFGRSLTLILSVAIAPISSLTSRFLDAGALASHAPAKKASATSLPPTSWNADRAPEISGASLAEATQSAKWMSGNIALAKDTANSSRLSRGLSTTDASKTESLSDALSRLR